MKDSPCMFEYWGFSISLHIFLKYQTVIIFSKRNIENLMKTNH